MIGLPAELYPTRYIEDGQTKTQYPIMIAGDNFGCGSSREHAPQSMGAAGARRWRALQPRTAGTCLARAAWRTVWCRHKILRSD